MEKIISFLIYFVIIYLLHLFTVILKKGKYTKYQRSKQVQYFVKKYNVDFKKISFKKFINTLSMINSFIMAAAIIAVQVLITGDTKFGLLLKLSLAFVLLLLLLMVCYGIYGKILERRNKHV